MKTLQLPDIGVVTIRKNKRSKALRATLQTDGSIQISIPYFVSYKEAIDFLQREKSKFIDLRKKHEDYNDKFETYVPGNIYRTKFHKFELKSHQQEDFFLKNIDEENYVILFPEKYDVKSDEIQYYLRQIIRDIYRFEAKNYIIPRTVMFAEKFGFHFNKIFIKNIKSRWGSCSSQKNLNFNLNLMRLPDHLIDYVILHELTHLKAPNHGSDFWQLLESMLPEARKIDKEIKKYPLRHFAT